MRARRRRPARRPRRRRARAARVRPRAAAIARLGAGGRRRSRRSRRRSRRRSPRRSPRWRARAAAAAASRARPRGRAATRASCALVAAAAAAALLAALLARAPAERAERVGLGEELSPGAARLDNSHAEDHAAEHEPGVRDEQLAPRPPRRARLPRQLAPPLLDLSHAPTPKMCTRVQRIWRAGPRARRRGPGTVLRTTGASSNWHADAAAARAPELLAPVAPVHASGQARRSPAARDVRARARHRGCPFSGSSSAHAHASSTYSGCRGRVRELARRGAVGASPAPSAADAAAPRRRPRRASSRSTRARRPRARARARMQSTRRVAGVTSVPPGSSPRVRHRRTRPAARVAPPWPGGVPMAEDGEAVDRRAAPAPPARGSFSMRGGSAREVVRVVVGVRSTTGPRARRGRAASS